MAEDKKTKALTSRGKTVDGESSGTKPTGTLISEAEAQAVRGNTMPPPKPDPSRFPSTIAEISGEESADEADVVRGTEELEVGEGVRPVRPDETMRTRVSGMIKDALGKPEEPEPVPAKIINTSAASSDTWSSVGIEGDEAAEENPLADLPAPEMAEGEVVQDESPEVAEPEVVSADASVDAEEASPEETNGTPHQASPYVELRMIEGGIVLEGPAVEVGDELIIGRDKGCGMVIESRYISRHHAVITKSKDGDKFVIIDLGSKQKTFVNDFVVERDKEFEIAHGDTIRFGRADCGAELVFHDPMVQKADVVADATVMNPDTDSQPADSVSADEPEKEEDVTKAEQHAETLSIDTGPLQGAVDSGGKDGEKPDADATVVPPDLPPPPADMKKADTKGDKKKPAGAKSASGGGTPPRLPPSTQNYSKVLSSVFIVLMLMVVFVFGAILVVREVIPGITGFFAETATVVPIAPPAQVAKTSATQLASTPVQGELADQVVLAVQVPEFADLRKIQLPDAYVPPAKSPIKDFARGVVLPKSFEDCFPKNATLEAAEVAWCCSFLHPNAGDLDELIRMSDCMIKLEQMQY